MVLPEWWLLSILVLLGIFVVIITSYVMSLHFASVEERRFRVLTELDPNYLDPNVLETTTLGQNVLDPSLIRTRERLEIWSRVAMRAYVVMVLSSALLYLASTFLRLESPFWYPLVLSGFIFASAYFVYRVWSKARE